MLSWVHLLCRCGGCTRIGLVKTWFWRGGSRSLPYKLRREEQSRFVVSLPLLDSRKRLKYLKYVSKKKNSLKRYVSTWSSCSTNLSFKNTLKFDTEWLINYFMDVWHASLQREGRIWFLTARSPQLVQTHNSVQGIVRMSYNGGERGISP